MTLDILTDLGEEYLMKNGYDGVSITVGLYLDATDSIGETSDEPDITTEPSDLAPSYNYSRQSVTVTAVDISGDWGVDNDAQISFDLSGDSTANDVDGAFAIVNFNATDTGDSSTNDHLVATFALSQTRDIGSIDTLNIAAGDLEITVN